MLLQQFIATMLKILKFSQDNNLLFTDFYSTMLPGLHLHMQ